MRDSDYFEQWKDEQLAGLYFAASDSDRVGALIDQCRAAL